MEFKIAGILGLISTIAFLAIWLILLLVAHPENLGTIEAAKETFLSMLASPDSRFFYLSLASMFACLTCSVLLFSKIYPVQVMYIILAHAVLGLFIYDWTLAFAIAIALPLTLFGKVKVSA